MRAKTAILYIFRQMLPIFLMGVFLFVAILLMFQVLRLTEFVLVHGVDMETIGQIMGFLSISFLPALFPMSLLFAVLLTYGRLSSDSEIIAFKSIGLNLKQIAFPAIVFSIIVATLSAKVSFQLAPWGNRQFEVIMAQLGKSKASATIKEGVFSEGFFDLVVYADKVDSKKGILKNVFIYDERDPNLPMTIISQSGTIVQKDEKLSQKAFIRLFDGNIHRTTGDIYTKIDFKTYDLHMQDPIEVAQMQKTLLSLSYTDLINRINASQENSPPWRTWVGEYHKRFALASACILFALLGVGLGAISDRRSRKSSGMVISLGLIILYWAIYISSENLSKQATLHPAFYIWSANFVFLILSIWALRKASRG